MLSQMYEILPRIQSFYSVSAMLLETDLPSFNTILSNCRVVFNKCMYKCNNV